MSRTKRLTLEGETVGGDDTGLSVGGGLVGDSVGLSVYRKK